MCWLRGYKNHGHLSMNFLLVINVNISYNDHATSEGDRRRSQAAIGEYDELTMVKKRKLRWFSHVSRSSGLAKTILQGTMNGKRRQRKKWEDNIKEWAAEDMTRWEGCCCVLRPR